MIHSTHLLDWRLYSSKIGGPSRDPGKPNDWASATESIRALCSPKEFSRMPDWKQELINNLFEDLEILLKPKKKETIQDIRDLHFLGILCCCVEQGEGYDKAWDVVKECLRHELGNEVGDDLILGRYWSGGAWNFIPDLLSYQFGFLEGERLKSCHQKALCMTDEKLVALLGKIDLKENYPSFGVILEPDDIKWVVESFHQLGRNLKRASERDLALFYMLD